MKRILVVEDTWHNRKILRDLLTGLASRCSRQSTARRVSHRLNCTDRT